MERVEFGVSKNEYFMRQSELNSKNHLKIQSFNFETLVSKRDNPSLRRVSPDSPRTPFSLKKGTKKATGKMRLEMAWGRGIINSACSSISNNPTLPEMPTANDG